MLWVITPVNERKIELYDVIKELISNNLKYNIVVFEQDIILEFENLNEPNEAQFIEKWNPSFEAEYYPENNNCYFLMMEEVVQLIWIIKNKLLNFGQVERENVIIFA